MKNPTQMQWIADHALELARRAQAPLESHNIFGERETLEMRLRSLEAFGERIAKVAAKSPADWAKAWDDSAADLAGRSAPQDRQEAGT